MRSRSNQVTLTLLAGVLFLLPASLDEWTASRTTARQIRAAAFRWESAAVLAPQREALRHIAVHGILTPDDLELARLAAGIVAADIYLTGDGDAQ